MMKTLVLGFACTLFVVGCSGKSVSTATADSKKSDPPVAKTESTTVVPKSASDGHAQSTTGDAATASSEFKPAEEVASSQEPAVKSPVPVDSEKSGVPKAEPLDLTSVYQTPAANFKNIGTYPWGDAPIGSQTFGNVPLEIGGMICLWGAKNAESGLVFPFFVEAISVQRKFDALYVYHATFNTAGDGTPVSNLILNFEDGTHSTFEVSCGNHVKGWLTPAGQSTELNDPKSKLVYRKKSSLSKPDAPHEMRFYITEIVNPQPASKVTTIEVVSAKEKSSYCFLAMTTGPAGLLKVESLPDPE